MVTKSVFYYTMTLLTYTLTLLNSAVTLTTTQLTTAAHIILCDHFYDQLTTKQKFRTTYEVTSYVRNFSKLRSCKANRCNIFVVGNNELKNRRDNKQNLKL